MELSWDDRQAGLNVSRNETWQHVASLDRLGLLDTSPLPRPAWHFMAREEQKRKAPENEQTEEQGEKRPELGLGQVREQRI